MKRITDNEKILANYQTEFYWQDSQSWKNTPFCGVNIIPEEKDAVKRFKDLFEKIAETLKIDHSTLSDLIDDPVVDSRIFPKFFLNFFK